MNILNQAEIFCTVNKNDRDLVSDTIFVGRDLEAKATLQVDINSFLINDAVWEIHRAPEGIAAGRGNAVSLLSGIEAHIEGKREMKRLMALSEGIVLKYLFTDCVKSLIQAETYVYRERGFADKPAYNRYWDKIEENGCRMNTHPDPSDAVWMDYVPQGRAKQQSFQ